MSKWERTCNQNFLILSLLYSSPVSSSLYSHCLSLSLPYSSSLPPPLCTLQGCSFFFTLSQHLLTRFSRITLCSLSQGFITCFQLQMNARWVHPRFHRNQNRLNQLGVLPDVRQQLVKAINVQSLDDQGGDVDGFGARHVVTQRHVVRAAVVALHLWQRQKFSKFKLQPCVLNPICILRRVL